jgi:hypothetical protein
MSISFSESRLNQPSCHHIKCEGRWKPLGCLSFRQKRTNLCLRQRNLLTPNLRIDVPTSTNAVGPIFPSCSNSVRLFPKSEKLADEENRQNVDTNGQHEEDKIGKHGVKIEKSHFLPLLTYRQRLMELQAICVKILHPILSQLPLSPFQNNKV